MTTLEAELAKVQSSVPECVGVAFIDMSTGMLLSVRTSDSHPQDVLDLVGPATGEIFQGANVGAIERLFKKARGMPIDGQHYFREILIMSDNLIHLFQRGRHNENLVLATVCRSSANLGMVLTKARAGLPAVELAA